MAFSDRLSHAVRALQGKPIKETGGLLTADPDLNLGYSSGGSKYFRPLTANPKDIRPYDHQRMLEIAVYLYQNNPLAKRIIERRTNFILGEGISIVADDKDVQEVITKFWKDSYNRLDRRLHAYVNAWRAYGELILHTTVNPTDGSVRLGFISPDRVTAVIPNEMNVQVIEQVQLKPHSPGAKDVVYNAINLDGDPKSNTYNMHTGECFFFTANTLPDMVRGLSDLWAIADYCDGYETTIWDLVERAGIVNAFVIHVTKDGASQEDLEQWWMKHGSEVPRAGEIVATNEKEKWEFLTPDFTGQNVSEWSDLILSMIATSADMPKFWLNAQLDPNRAAAEQMAGPVVKGLTELQREFTGIMEDIIEFVIDQAILARTLNRDVNREFRVEVPEISGKDLAGAGQTFLQSTQGLAAARAEGLIDEKTARRVLVQLVSRLGIEATIEEVEAEIEKETKRAEKDKEQVPQERVPFPGAENTGSAARAGAPRKTPTPRVPHSAPDGDQGGAALQASVQVTAHSVSRILEEIENLRESNDLVAFGESVSRIPDGQNVLVEVIRQGKVLDGWLPPVLQLVQEKKCGRSGIRDDYTCHIGGGGGGVTRVSATKTAEVGWAAIEKEVRAGKETGFTLDPHTQGQPGSGWVVAAYHGTNERIPDAPENASAADIEQFVNDYMADWENPEAKVGAWLNPADKSLHLDVVIVKPGKVDAVAQAVEKNQVSVFNLETGETYELTKEDYKRYGGEEWEGLWDARPTEAMPDLNAGGRVPVGTLILETDGMRVLRVRGGTYSIIGTDKKKNYVIGRGLTSGEADRVVEALLQEKKCGRSGIRDDYTCHVGGAPGPDAYESPWELGGAGTDHDTVFQNATELFADQLVEPLSSTEEGAVYDYCGSMYSLINSVMREDDKSASLTEAKKAKYQELGREVLAAIDKCRPLGEAIVVYRGGRVPKGIKEGDILEERGILSTSCHAMTAASFADNPVTEAVIEVVVPEGAKALYPSTHGLTDYESEMEVVLPPGRLRVVSDITSQKYPAAESRRVVRMEFIP